MGGGGRKRRGRYWWRLAEGDGGWILSVFDDRLNTVKTTPPCVWGMIRGYSSCLFSLSQLSFTVSPCQCHIAGLLFWQQWAIKDTHVPLTFIAIMVPMVRWPRESPLIWYTHCKHNTITIVRFSSDYLNSQGNQKKVNSGYLQQYLNYATTMLK